MDQTEMERPGIICFICITKIDDFHIALVRRIDDPDDVVIVIIPEEVFECLKRIGVRQCEVKKPCPCHEDQA